METRVSANATHNATYIGAEACGVCHRQAFDAWQNSHHALAMTEARPETVNASFDEQYTYADIESRFETGEQGYAVTTDVPKV